jgi:hypothetical protein
MAPLGLADFSRQSDKPQIYGDISDVTGRLSRSAIIALLASPVGLIIISVARLLIISNYNPATASAVVASGGYVDTLLGTTIPLIPIFIPYLGLVLLFFNRVILGALAILTAALISPAAMDTKSIIALVNRDWSRITHLSKPVIVVMALMAVVLACLLLVEFAGIGISDFLKTVAAVSCILALPFAIKVYPLPINHKFYSELIRQPWLPAQTITLMSGQKFTGYVLSDEPSFVVVLTNNTRTIRYYPIREIVALQLCQLGEVSVARPLVTLAPAGTPASPPTPSCATSSAGPPPANRPGGRYRP